MTWRCAYICSRCRPNIQWRSAQKKSMTMVPFSGTIADSRGASANLPGGHMDEEACWLRHYVHCTATRENRAPERTSDERRIYYELRDQGMTRTIARHIGRSAPANIRSSFSFCRASFHFCCIVYSSFHFSAVSVLSIFLLLLCGVYTFYFHTTTMYQPQSFFINFFVWWLSTWWFNVCFIISYFLFVFFEFFYFRIDFLVLFNYFIFSFPLFFILET